MASYALAIDMGADFIEPALVPTRDGALIVRFASGIGPDKRLSVPQNPDGSRSGPTRLKKKPPPFFRT